LLWVRAESGSIGQRALKDRERFGKLAGFLEGEAEIAKGIGIIGPMADCQAVFRNRVVEPASLVQ